MQMMPFNTKMDSTTYSDLGRLAVHFNLSRGAVVRALIRKEAAGLFGSDYLSPIPILPATEKVPVMSNQPEPA